MRFCKTLQTERACDKIPARFPHPNTLVIIKQELT